MKIELIYTIELIYSFMVKVFLLVKRSCKKKECLILDFHIKPVSPHLDFWFFCNAIYCDIEMKLGLPNLK